MKAVVEVSMFTGRSIDELIEMVEEAEQHALLLSQEARELEMATLAYHELEEERLAGVA